MMIGEILTRVCELGNLVTPASFTGSTDSTAKMLLAHAVETGEEITRRAEWSKLFRSQAIAASASSIALPDDFHRMIKGGSIVLGGTSYGPVLPVKSMDQWQFLSVVPSTQRFFFISNGSVLFSPAIGADGATMHYVSRYWITDGTDEITSDENEPVFSGELMALGVLWRYKRAKGAQFADTASEFEAELARELAADRGVSL